MLKNSFLSIYFCINFVGVNLQSSVPGVSVPDFIMFVLHLIWGKGVYQMPLFEQFVFTWCCVSMQHVCMCCIGDLIWFGNSTSKYKISGRRQVDTIPTFTGWVMVSLSIWWDVGEMQLRPVFYKLHPFEVVNLMVLLCFGISIEHLQEPSWHSHWSWWKLAIHQETDFSFMKPV